MVLQISSFPRPLASSPLVIAFYQQGLDLDFDSLLSDVSERPLSCVNCSPAMRAGWFRPNVDPFFDTISTKILSTANDYMRIFHHFHANAADEPLWDCFHAVEL